MVRQTAREGHSAPSGCVCDVIRLMLVEDDLELRSVLIGLLQQSGYETDAFADGDAAFASLAAKRYDLAVIDLLIPGMGGLMLVRTLRREGSRIPILIVTGRAALDDRITGLEAGADDYLSKPFAMVEFEARVRALLRRRSAQAGGLIRVGPLSVTPGEPRVRLGEVSVTLSRGESVVLETLAARAGRVVSKAALAQRSRERGEEPSTNAIEIRVLRLRRRLEPFGIRIRSLRGFGYVLDAGEEK
jgi:two-component system OmpR family response regulator